MKAPRYRRIVGELLGTSKRTGGLRAGARDVSIKAHRGPNDHGTESRYTGLTRPNRFY